MSTEQGYNNQLKLGTPQFKTIHSSGSNSYGTVSINKSLYDISTSNQTIVSVTDVLSKDGQVQFWQIQITSHSAKVGDILRILSGNAINIEFEIMQVVDANNIRILPINSSKPAASNTARIMGWIVSKSTSSGSQLVESTDAIRTSNYAELLTISNTVASTTSLTSAKWILIQADNTNTVALRFRMSGTATATSGIRLTAGSSIQIECAGTLSVIAEAAATNQKLYIIFGT